MGISKWANVRQYLGWGNASPHPNRELTTMMLYHITSLARGVAVQLKPIKLSSPTCQCHAAQTALVLNNVIRNAVYSLY